MVFPNHPYKGPATLLLLCLFAVTINAQDRKAAHALYTDLPIADMSGFTLLHVNPYKIARPAGAREFSAALMCIAKSDVSNAIPGIALEWAPYQTFEGNRINPDRDSVFAVYRKSLLLRNLQLSFGGAQDSFASRMAAGLSLVIFDNSDPSRDPEFAKSMLAIVQASTPGRTMEEAQKSLQDDFLHERLDPFFGELGLRPETDSALYRLFNFQAPDLNRDSIRLVIARKFGARLGFDRGFDTPKERAVNKIIDDYLRALKKVVAIRQRDPQVLAKLAEEMQKEFVRKHWNASVLKIGLGNTWYAPDFNWSHLEPDKFSVYASWAIRVTKWGQGILFAQYAHIYAEDAKKRSSWVYGGRIVGGTYRIHGSLETAFHTNTYGRLYRKLRNDINTIRVSLGLEAQVTEGLWAEVTVGTNGPYSDFARNDGVVLAGILKYTFTRR